MHYYSIYNYARTGSLFALAFSFPFAFPFPTLELLSTEAWGVVGGEIKESGAVDDVGGRIDVEVIDGNFGRC